MDFKIVELEERIEDAKLRKGSIESETITLDNIYKLMLNSGKLYDIISDEEKKNPYYLSHKRNSDISKWRVRAAFEVNRV